MKLVIVASTRGSVMNQLLGNEYFKSRVHSVVSDRDCGAITCATAHGLPGRIFPEKDKEKFSALVLEYLKAEAIDYAVSFYTRLFAGELLHEYRDRIVNLHPSLLPSFKGLHGFEEAIAYGVRYVGSTIHFIDEHMDQGKIIQQTIARIDDTKPIAFTRHRIFEQQCRSLLQVVKWLEEGRLVVEGNRVRIKDVTYDADEFSPGLDFAEALELKIPMPAELAAEARP